MKISRTWLQNYFETPLPDITTLADALTFHSSEIESADGDVLDVKVLPNRAADLLSHRGIAKELSAILNIPLKSDPLRDPPMMDIGCPSLVVEVQNPKKCLRFIGAVVQGVKVGPSPAWLKGALESVGQRSINNVVDATNYVMLNLGQPMHAFDAEKLNLKNGAWAIKVREASTGEKITVLSGEEYLLPEGAILITDGNSNEPIGIAGIKGGKPASITEETKDIIVEAANFDGTSIRKTAQALKLFTDASQRFQNRPSPELAPYALREVLKIITDVAGGTVVGVVDVYPKKQEIAPVSITAEKVLKHLGVSYSEEDISDVFSRLGLSYTKVGSELVVTPPFERRDITISEDLVEEVGRIIGYDRVPATALLPLSDTPDMARFRGIEKVKDALVAEGFTEVSTQSFALTGEVFLANPLDKTKPALRAGLSENIKEAMERAIHHAALVLGPKQELKLFEIGTVFSKNDERVVVATSEPVDVAPISDDAGYHPKKYTLDVYKPFSVYPFIARDIALWVPAQSSDMIYHITTLLREQAGELLVRCDLFDQFEKDEKISYAFRLIFQSYERTLSDAEVNTVMEKVTGALNAVEGWRVR